MDEDLIQEFVIEARDHLEAVEPDLLAMERDGADTPPEMINSIFRAVHSIKGASGFFGLTPITELSHAMENLLSRIRDGIIAPEPQTIDVLLAGADKLRLMIDDVHASTEVPVAEVKAALSRLLGQGGARPEPAASAAPAATAPAHALATAGDGEVAVAEGLYSLNAALVSAMNTQEVFVVTIYGGRDLAAKGRTLAEFKELLASCGTCLSSRPPIPEAELAAEEAARFVYATILEQALVGPALDIGDSQVAPVEMMASQDERKKAGGPPPEPPAPVSPIREETDRQDSHLPKPKEGERKKAAAQETIRVNVELLDSLMNIAGELVLGRNQLRQEVESIALRNPRLNAILQHVGQVTTEIQENIMRIRMQPVSSVLNKFPRMVRDLSKQLGKQVELEIIGGEVELDKSIIEGLSDPLTHIIRNSIDHGIETPSARSEAGKPAGGRIVIRAFHEGGQVNITVADDGRGIDATRVAAKAVAKGFIDGESAARLNDQEKLRLIFLAGLSTAEKVSDVSGRGVGMDVVKTNIERLGGHLQLESTPGHGTEVRLRLPLTLAIIPCLLVGAERERFAIPQINVKEIGRAHV